MDVKIAQGTAMLEKPLIEQRPFECNRSRRASSSEDIVPIYNRGGMGTKCLLCKHREVMDVTYHFSRFCQDCDDLLVTKYNQLLHPDMEPVWEWITAKMDAKSDEATRLENLNSAISEETQEEIDLRIGMRLGEFLTQLKKFEIDSAIMHQP